MSILRSSLYTLLLFPVLASAQSPAQTAQLQKDSQEIQAYTLTMDVITRTYQTLHEISEAVKADPALQKSAGGDTDEEQKTLDQMSALMSKSPRLNAIITAHNFTPRSFATAEMSLILTGIAIAALDAGASMQDLTSKTQVNAANLKLIRDHRAEVDALAAKYPFSGS